jgi:hypothetical protein
MAPTSRDDVDPLEGNREIEDYEDFIDVSRRVHTKLFANVAKALTDADTRVRRQLGLPPRDADRLAARMPAASDLLLDLGRLHLEFVDRLADLTREHGTDVERALEGLLARVPRSTSRTTRFEIDAYDPGNDAPYEPATRTLRFRVRTDDLQPDSPVDVQCEAFADIETGEKVVPRDGERLATASLSAAERGASDRDASITVNIDRRLFQTSHAYASTVRLLVNGAVSRTFQIILRVLPKPALPLLELRRSPGKRWESRPFPITNDTGAKATLEVTPWEGRLANTATANADKGPGFKVSINGRVAKDEGPTLSDGETATCTFTADDVPTDGATYEEIVRVVLHVSGRQEEAARLRLRARNAQPGSVPAAKRKRASASKRAAAGAKAGGRRAK